jgi:hypothetical protein
MTVFADIEDLLLNAPNVIPDIRNWFRDYKTPDGKLPSLFAFDGKAMPKVRLWIFQSFGPLMF